MQIGEQQKEFRLAFARGKHQFFFLYDNTACSFMEAIGREVDKELFEAEIDVDSSTTFDKVHLEHVVDFYSDSNWKPRVISKVFSSKFTDYKFTEPEYAFILRCSDNKQFSKLYECAKFFDFRAAVHLCFVVVGTRVHFDSNDLTSLHNATTRLGITDPLDNIRAIALKKKYAFLNNPPDISGDSDTGEEELGEEEDAEEEEEISTVN